jgi:hypothetical protein
MAKRKSTKGQTTIYKTYKAPDLGIIGKTSSHPLFLIGSPTAIQT